MVIFHSYVKLPEGKPPEKAMAYCDGTMRYMDRSNGSMAMTQDRIHWRYGFHRSKAYVYGLCKGISPQNMALYGTVPPLNG